MKVTDPDGMTWRVTRRWVPWRRRFKGGWEMLPDLPVADDPIVVGVLLLLCLPVLLLVVVAGLEFLLLLLILPFAILARVLFGRHWMIEARQGWTPVWEEPAGSWRQSGQAIRDVATAIQHGHRPPPNLPGG